MALLKWNEIKVFIKNGAFLIREGSFNKSVSEAYPQIGEGRGTSGSAWYIFVKG